MQNALPDVLCVVQVALEGAVSKKAALNSLAQGNLPQVTLLRVLQKWRSRCRTSMQLVDVMELLKL